MQIGIANLLYEKIDYSKIVSELDLVLISELDEEESKIYKLYNTRKYPKIRGYFTIA